MCRWCTDGEGKAKSQRGIAAVGSIAHSGKRRLRRVVFASGRLTRVTASAGYRCGAIVVTRRLAERRRSRTARFGVGWVVVTGSKWLLVLSRVMEMEVACGIVEAVVEVGTAVGVL